MAAHTAFRDTECSDCTGDIRYGQPIYFKDTGKVCEHCAEVDGLVCRRCGNQKKPEYETCWHCAQIPKTPEKDKEPRRSIKIGMKKGGRR